MKVWLGLKFAHSQVCYRVERCYTIILASNQKSLSLKKFNMVFLHVHMYLHSRALSGHSTSSDHQTGPSVILDTPGGGNSGLDGDDDDDQFVVQDSTPLELPQTDAFLSPPVEDKPEGI